MKLRIRTTLIFKNTAESCNNFKKILDRGHLLDLRLYNDLENARFCNNLVWIREAFANCMVISKFNSYDEFEVAILNQ